MRDEEREELSFLFRFAPWQAMKGTKIMKDRKKRKEYILSIILIIPIIFLSISIIFSSHFFSSPKNNKICSATEVDPLFGLVPYYNENNKNNDILNCQLPIQSYFLNSKSFSPAVKDILYNKYIIYF